MRILTTLLIAAMLTAPQTLKVDVELVNVNVRVTDDQGRPVLGLKAEQFQVWEDRVGQTIENFSTEEVPASIGLVLDVSASMKGSIETVRKAAVTFLKLGTTQDEFFIVTFSDRAQLLIDFTNDVAALQNKIALGTDAKGRTALFDALYLGVDKVKRGRNPRKALVLLSDGGDNHSHYTAENFYELMREQDVQIFNLPLVNRVFIDGISRMGAGRPVNEQDIEGFCARVSAELRHQYLLSYRSTNTSKDGKWRDILVKVAPLRGSFPFSVHARRGYYAPSF